MCQPQAPSVGSMDVFSLSSHWSNNITFFVTWSWLNLPLVVITFIQHLSDHCLVTLRGCLTHQKCSFLFSSCHCLLIQHWVHTITTDCLLWCCWTSRDICPTLSHDDLLHLSCPSSLNNISISYFDRPHFTCCLIGFLSEIGIKNNLISTNVTFCRFLFLKQISVDV